MASLLVPYHVPVRREGASMGSSLPTEQFAGGTPEITIEPARWSDIGAVVDIQRSSFRPGLAYGRFALTTLKLTPGVRFLVARTPDRAVAGCIIGDIHRGDARVMNIAVHPDARRQGIGTRLLLALEAAFPHGDVVLMAEEPNRGAQALYAQVGFERTSRAPNYYGRGHHGIWMRKRRSSNPTTISV
jgi:ribosomal-protein-alanine N-acetyltransferase